MENLVSSHAAIQKAIQRDVVESLLEQSTLIPHLLTNRQIDKILCLPWRDRWALEEHGIIPVTYGKRIFYYSPPDIPDLFTSNNDHY